MSHLDIQKNKITNTKNNENNMGYITNFDFNNIFNESSKIGNINK